MGSPKDEHDMLKEVFGDEDDDPIDYEIIQPMGSSFSSMLSSVYEGIPERDIGEFIGQEGPI